MRTIKKIHIHHVAAGIAMFDGSNYTDLKQLLRKWHVIERGWSDIGYHKIIYPDGKIDTARKLSKKPASIKWHNRGAIAICLWGNFDKDVIKAKQYSALITLTKDYMEQFNLKASDIIFHRDINTKKSCPGKNIPKADFIDNLMLYEKIFGNN